MGKCVGDLCLNLTFWVSVSCSALIAHAGISARDTSLKKRYQVFRDVRYYKILIKFGENPREKKIQI